jgi:hypothetical protein
MKIPPILLKAFAGLQFAGQFPRLYDEFQKAERRKRAVEACGGEDAFRELFGNEADPLKLWVDGNRVDIGPTTDQVRAFFKNLGKVDLVTAEQLSKAWSVVPDNKLITKKEGSES